MQLFLSVSTSDGQPHGLALVDCAATLDFVSEYFVTRIRLSIRKAPIEYVYVRLANGQRVSTSTLCEVKIALAQCDFVHTIRDLGAADIVLGLPWQDAKQGTRTFSSAERRFPQNMER
jgi:hypothetical protein